MALWEFSIFLVLCILSITMILQCFCQCFETPCHSHEVPVATYHGPIWDDITHSMILSVYLRSKLILLNLSYTIYGSVSFQIIHFFCHDCENMCTSITIIIKLVIYIISHCLGLGHEQTMVWLYVLLYVSLNLEYRATCGFKQVIVQISCKRRKIQFVHFIFQMVAQQLLFLPCFIDAVFTLSGKNYEVTATDINIWKDTDRYALISMNNSRTENISSILFH